MYVPGTWGGGFPTSEAAVLARRLRRRSCEARSGGGEWLGIIYWWGRRFPNAVWIIRSIHMPKKKAGIQADQDFFFFFWWKKKTPL